LEAAGFFHIEAGCHCGRAVMMPFLMRRKQGKITGDTAAAAVAGRLRCSVWYQAPATWRLWNFGMAGPAASIVSSIN
jgi:hypothetical protein